MKKVVMLMLGLVAGTASFADSTNPASPTTTTRVVMTTDHKLKVFVQPTESKGDLAIKDGEGHVLYNATVALNKGLRQQFDVSNLGIGTYKLTLTTGDQTLTKTFVVQPAPETNFIMLES